MASFRVAPPEDDEEGGSYAAQKMSSSGTVATNSFFSCAKRHRDVYARSEWGDELNVSLV